MVWGYGRALSASESYFGNLRLWDLKSGESRWFYTNRVTALAALPDGRALSVSDSYYGNCNLRLWDLKSGESRVLAGHTSRVTALAALPDGRALSVSESYFGNLRLWDLKSGESRVLAGHTSRVTALAALPDGRALSGSEDRSVIIWDLARGAPIAAFVGDAAITCVAATSTHLLAGSENGAIHILRLHL